MTFLRESYIVFRRQMRMNLRNPAWVIIGMLQPVLYLLLFGPLLKPLVEQLPGRPRTPTRSSCPGMLVQLGIFGAFFAGFSADRRVARGRHRGRAGDPGQPHGAAGRPALPRRAAAVRAGADPDRRSATRSACDASVAGVVLGIVLTLLIGGACAAASNALALTTKSEDVMAPVINMVMMPVLLLSGILLPMTIGPAWLRAGQRLHADPARSSTPSAARSPATSPSARMLGPPGHAYSCGTGRWESGRSRAQPKDVDARAEQARPDRVDRLRPARGRLRVVRRRHPSYVVERCRGPLRRRHAAAPEGRRTSRSTHPRT